MELIIILLLILLNGIFSMSEMALVSSKKFKLESDAAKGQSSAKTALELAENPNKFLSTVQIGITLIGILVGIYSGDKITSDAAILIAKIDVLAPYANNIAGVTVVLLVTFFSIVLGELLPKRLGLTFPEKIATIVARPMLWLSIITSPFVWLLTKTNELLLKILGLNKVNEEAATEEEIKSIVKQSAEVGQISDFEQNIVERVFELGDTKVDHLFTHRNDVTYFTLEDSWQTIKNKVYNDKHSAYPVCKEDDIDTITGIVILKDLFTPQFSQQFDIQSVMREPLFINENAYAYNVLQQFKTMRTHYGIVVDEYGNVQGIITMDDVMDALIGDMKDSNDDEYELIQRNENSWLVDGQYNLKTFLKQFPLTVNPASYEEYNTVAGLILSQTETLPVVGTKISIGEFVFEVIDKDGQRIDKILVEKPDTED